MMPLEKRGKAMASWIMGPLIGPTVGPLSGCCLQSFIRDLTDGEQLVVTLLKPRTGVGFSGSYLS